jgi:REP element-mobilizing transposase RayT
MNETRWHKAFELYAHITWRTRWSEHAVAKSHVEIIAQSIMRAAERQHMRVIAQAVLADHVHVLVSFRPDSQLSSFVRDAKSESSRRAETVSWGRGYYAGSVCRGHIAAVRAYIARQHSHHPDLIPPG